jgi:hypothetical protein
VWIVFVLSIPALAAGERLFVLIIFANPAITETSKARVMCDYEVERPDGTISVREKARCSPFDLASSALQCLKRSAAQGYEPSRISRN